MPKTLDVVVSRREPDTGPSSTALPPPRVVPFGRDLFLTTESGGKDLDVRVSDPTGHETSSPELKTEASVQSLQRNSTMDSSTEV